MLFSLCCLLWMGRRLGNEPSWPCDKGGREFGGRSPAPAPRRSWTVYAQALLRGRKKLPLYLMHRYSGLCLPLQWEYIGVQGW